MALRGRYLVRTLGRIVKVPGGKLVIGSVSSPWRGGSSTSRLLVPRGVGRQGGKSVPRFSRLRLALDRRTNPLRIGGSSAESAWAPFATRVVSPKALLITRRSLSQGCVSEKQRCEAPKDFECEEPGRLLRGVGVSRLRHTWGDPRPRTPDASFPSKSRLVVQHRELPVELVN